VVNLSLGGAGGPHDGTTDIEAGLDALFPNDVPGRALVVAAGNEGSRDYHAGGWSLDGEVSLPLLVSSSTPQNGALSVELWADGALAISVVDPSGNRFGPAKAGTGFDTGKRASGQVVIDNSAPARSDGRRDGAVVLVGPAGASPAKGTWRIVLSGHALRYDLWIVETAVNTRFTDRITEDDRLSTPASSHNAISVGSFISRTSWMTNGGDTITRPIVVGDSSSFSSTGPTFDGRFAPDLVAPGEFIISALSHDSAINDPSSSFYVGPGMPGFSLADDGVHGILRGTSQAAPHVAGAIALLLQADPTLTAKQIREILRATSRDDGRGYSPRLGFGRLDVLAAVRYARGLRGGAVSAGTSSVGVSRDALPPGELTTVATVTPRDANGVPLGPGHAVDIVASAGAPIGPVFDTGAGRYERVFVAHARRGQVGLISATVDGVALDAHPQVFFVVDRSEIGRSLVAGGGCSSTGDEGNLGAVLLVICLLQATRRRLRSQT
jgi:subtilisin family serine protease